jgi:hypothetical protein
MFKLILVLSNIIIININTTAQNNYNASQNATLQLTNAIEIEFTQGGGFFGVVMSFNSSEHYQNGITATNAATIRVRSNKHYNITVKAGAANFYSLFSTTPMPVNGVLHVKETNQNNFINLSNTDQNLLVNQNRGINNYNLTYKATPGFSYSSGYYFVPVIYTATQN